ncbi:MAG: DUF5666 domain-containing protein [Pseudomonadota bacterium]
MKRFVILASCLFALTTFVALAADEKNGDDDVEAGTIGTGIMGEITGLGSIHVSGVRIALPQNLVLRAPDGTVRQAGAVSAGETVVVDAVPSQDGLTATRISHFHPIVAPVESISSDHLRLLSLDIDIAGLSANGLAPGDWVAVSGLWRDNTLVASHLRPMAAQKQITVNGTYRLDGNGHPKIGPFHLDSPVDARVGDHLRVSGDWMPEGMSIRARDVDSGLFALDQQQLLVEGYMSQPDANGTYFIFGSGTIFTTEDPNMRVPSERSVFCVHLGPQPSFTQLLSLSMSRTDRLDLLEQLPVDTTIFDNLNGGCGAAN